ncbi:hypothetical protein MP228_004923 [Amoeboaphelidium protococcarum]|nr:hypothetical protein MP228_004923 [Amoeboaphelidium protococcarum]
MENLLEFWDPKTVGNWLVLVGYDSYERIFVENEITGEMLLYADLDLLKELEVKSVGHRMALIREIRELKQSQGYEDLADDRQQMGALRQLGSNADISGSDGNLSRKADAQNPRLGLGDSQSMERLYVDDNQFVVGLKQQVDQMEEELQELRQIVNELIKERSSTQFGDKSSSTISTSNTKRMTTPSNPSTVMVGKQKKYTLQGLFANDQNSSDNDRRLSSPLDPNQTAGALKIYGYNLENREYESYKSVFMSVTDTCSKVLPLTLKKWKLADDWKKYAIFMEYKGQEKCLSYDDCPLALYFQLKTEVDVPKFFLKNIRADSMNPAMKNVEHLSIVEALRNSKGDLFGRKIRSITNTNTDTDTSSRGKSDTKTTDMTTTSEESLVDAQRGASSENAEGFASPDSNRNNYGQTTDIIQEEDEFSNADSEKAVAIYEYKAEREDELDVNIGDTFIIKDKNETGWWIVEKQGKTGWVPAGCLLEEDQVNQENDQNQNQDQQGLALFDYSAIGVNEMSLSKGDKLIVHKTYRHWLLAEKNGQNGWVPSCYVSINNGNDIQPTGENSFYPSAENLNNANESGGEIEVVESPQDEPERDDRLGNVKVEGPLNQKETNIIRSDALNFKALEKSDSSLNITTTTLKVINDKSNTIGNVQGVSERMLKKNTTGSFQQFNELIDRLRDMATSPPEDDDHFDAPGLDSAQTNQLTTASLQSKTSPHKNTLLKLDSLLDSFDPYLSEQQQQQL